MRFQEAVFAFRVLGDLNGKFPVWDACSLSLIILKFYKMKFFGSVRSTERAGLCFRFL